MYLPTKSGLDIFVVLEPRRDNQGQSRTFFDAILVTTTCGSSGSARQNKKEHLLVVVMPTALYHL